VLAAAVFSLLTDVVATPGLPLLQEKSLLQSQEVQELLRSHRASKSFNGAHSGSAGYTQLAGSLAQFTAHWSGADLVTVTQNQVFSYK
jgi:hypothetical protein